MKDRAVLGFVVLLGLSGVCLGLQGLWIRAEAIWLTLAGVRATGTLIDSQPSIVFTCPSGSKNNTLFQKLTCRMGSHPYQMVRFTQKGAPQSPAFRQDSWIASYAQTSRFVRGLEVPIRVSRDGSRAVIDEPALGIFPRPSATPVYDAFWLFNGLLFLGLSAIWLRRKPKAH
ncbi:MAG: hypothetical protein SFU83_01300 [Meiothermus sp.]|nr:hypothetical protein [Meiothermus sp.]